MTMPTPITAPNRRILVVDDNTAIHGDFRKILGPPDDDDAALDAAAAKLFGTPQAVSFEIDAASQGEEGLEMVKRSLAEGRPYSMAFVDVRMPPGWDGIETTRQIWAVCPDLQFVICTAYSDCSWSEMQEQIQPGDRMLILKKPFDTIEVLQLANALTEKWRLLQESRSLLENLEHRVKQRTQDLEESRLAAMGTMEEAVRNRQEVVHACEDLQREMAERRKLEEKLRDHARLLDLAHDAIIVHDMECRVQYWNDGATRLYGWSAGEMIGKDIRERGLADPEKFAPAMEQLMGKGVWVGELRQQHKDGHEIAADSRWTLVRDESGRPKCVLVINTDITENKNIETQLLRAQRLDSVGRLTSGIAHDLNNILTPILLAISVLRQQMPEAAFERLLKVIETNTVRSADLIRQLLAFGRGSGGRRMPVQLNHLVNDVTGMLRETFPRNITLVSGISEHGWPVIGDETQLHQVLVNLCVNARDAMPGGGTLSLTTRNVLLDETYTAMNPGAKCGPHVLLQVTDTGSGMTRDTADKIFEPYFTTKQTGEGTGLGLSTVIGIVKSHGGFLNVRSEVGKGSTFEVHLPATTEAVAPASEPADAPLPQGNGELILVVDDEPAIREVIAKALLQQGYRVLAANDGAHAIALHSQHKGEIKAVLSDILMPLMDGITMARILKRIEPSLNIIASSGIAGGQERTDIADQLASMGVKTFLSKPYTAGEMVTAIHEMCPA